jgi:hypothetical protein
MLRLVVVSAWLWFVPSAASADAIGPPPSDCPDGSEGRSCHGNAYCAVDGCISPAECAFGDGCVVRELCIETVPCFGGAGGTMVTTVTSTGCAGCAGRCESHFVCAGDGAVDAGPPRIDAGRRDAGRPLDGGRLDGGSGGRGHVMYCGCGVPSRRATTPGVLLALGAALAAVLAARRR